MDASTNTDDDELPHDRDFRLGQCRGIDLIGP